MMQGDSLAFLIRKVAAHNETYERIPFQPCPRLRSFLLEHTLTPGIDKLTFLFASTTRARLRNPSSEPSLQADIQKLQVFNGTTEQGRRSSQHALRDSIDLAWFPCYLRHGRCAAQSRYCELSERDAPRRRRRGDAGYREARTYTLSCNTVPVPYQNDQSDRRKLLQASSRSVEFGITAECD